MPQPRVELAGGFAFGSCEVAEEFGSALKLGYSRRRFLESTHELQQLPQPLLVEFLREKGVLRALILQGYLVAITSCFSAGIHPAAPSPAQLDFTDAIIPARRSHPDLLSFANHAIGPPSLKIDQEVDARDLVIPG
jgi:hypothetical protein